MLYYIVSHPAHANAVIAVLDYSTTAPGDGGQPARLL
jgi:hypothetical protein